MPLQRQRTSFPVTAGQDQGVAPELVDPPTLIRAHNMSYTRAGELSKRLGWSSQLENAIENSSEVSMLQPERLAKRGNEILWIGEGRGNGLVNRRKIGFASRIVGEADPSIDSVWYRRDRVSRFNARKFTELTTKPGLRVRSVDTAYCGETLLARKGLLCVIWQYDDSRRIEYALIDIDTNSKISQGVVIDDGTALKDAPIRVVALYHGDFGTGSGEWVFHIFYTQEVTSVTETIRHKYIKVASSPYALNSDVSPIQANCGGWDICVTEKGATEQRLFVCYHNFTTSSFAVSEFTPSLIDSSLTFRTNLVTSIAAVPGEYLVNNTMQCCCDPNGLHVAIVSAALTPGCAGVTSNWMAQVNAAASPSHALTFFDDVTLVNYPNDTYSDTGGLQVGWAGTKVVSSVTRRDNWYATWMPFALGVSGVQNGIWVSEILANTGTTLSFSNNQERSAIAFGRPFIYRGQCYEPVATGVTADSCVVEIAAFEPRQEAAIQPYYAGRFLGGEIARAGSKRDYLKCKGRNSTVESHYEPGRFFSSFITLSLDGQADKITVMDLDARDPQRFDWAEIAGGTYFSGSIPWVYDGLTGHEIGFSGRPQSAASVLGDIIAYNVPEVLPDYPALTPAGSYNVALVWESIDAMGRVTQSAPSLSNVVAIGAGEIIKIDFLMIGRTSHPNVYAVPYVSNDGGLNYIRSQQQIPITTGNTQVNLDSRLLFKGNMPKLYTSDGILENSPPPQARFTAAWQGRVWFANDRDVWYSRELIDGESSSFNEALSFQLPMNCSGIAGLDDRFIIFGTDSIYWISGDGPTDTGSGGSFSQPQHVATDFGCIDARSIVMTEKGLCFQSRRGIELLTRSLEPQLISSGIDKFIRDDGFNEIVSASWDPAQQVCRFVLVQSGSSCIIACWHSLYNVWTTSDIPRQLSAGHASVPVDVINASSRNWLALADTTANELSAQVRLAWERDPGSSQGLDGPLSSPYQFRGYIETANIKLDGLLGFQRIWRVYALVKGAPSTTGFSLNYANNYSFANAGPDRVWATATDIASLETPSANHKLIQLHVDKQKSSAIRIYLSDVPFDPEDPLDETVYNGFYTIVGFGVEWGQEPGTGRGAERSKK